MLRVSEQTRQRVQHVASVDYGGATADDAIRRLLDEHWERSAVEAVAATREHDPAGWADYLAEADEWASAEARPADEWASA